MSAHPTRGARLAAWSVHAYTALGAPIGFAALAATLAGDHRAAFLWMALALFVDATDGALARAARVKDVVPQFDGARLDDIVDYLNFTFVPLFFAWHTGMLPPGWGVVAVVAPLLASTYGFCQTHAKTEAETGDFFFIGFPSYWNLVVFYQYTLGTGPVTNAVVLLVLAILCFVPLAYVYPSRTPTLRPLTITLGSLWSIALVVAMIDFPPAPVVVWGSLAFPVYYFGLSFALDWKRRRALDTPGSAPPCTGDP